MSNYIPHETITCDDRNQPWIDEKIKFILHKNRDFNAYSQDKNNTDLFQKFHSRLSVKPLDSKTIPRTYSSILKVFLNNNMIPCIPPLLHNGKFFMHFKEKAELNDFFARQFSLANNNSKLPSFLNKKRASHFQQLIFQHMIS